jgi:hypothetical protein
MLEGVDKLLHTLNTKFNRVKENVNESVKRDVTALLRNAVNQEAPVKTGLLRQSVQPVVTVGSGVGIVSVTLKPPQSEYSYHTETYRDYATKTGTLHVVNYVDKKGKLRQKRMHYLTKEKTVRKLEKKNPAVRYIHIIEGGKKGTPSNPFRTRAIKNSEEQIKRILETAIRKAIEQ